MPIYNYKCEKCSAITEHLTSIKTRDELHYCHACQEISSKRIEELFKNQLSFKGCWYTTTKSY